MPTVFPDLHIPTKDMAMPRQELMTYSPTEKRWPKMYRRQRFSVLVSVLGGSSRLDTLEKANAYARQSGVDPICHTESRRF